MKKYIKFIAFSIVLFCFQNTFGQLLKQRDIILQPYFGFPNMQKTTIGFNNDGSLNDYKIKAFGHVGLSGEYLLSPKWGIGIYAIYSPFSISASSYNEIDYDTGEFIEIQSNRKIISNRYRFMFMLFPHIDIDNPKWDLFFSLGVGILNYKSRYFIEGNEVSYKEYVKDNFLYAPTENATNFPIAARVAFGTRYFINDKLGLNFEAGIGGPLLSIGMLFKFNADNNNKNQDVETDAE